TDAPLMTRDEAAGRCRLSIRTFERHVRFQGRGVFVGGRGLFKREDILRWVDEQKVGDCSKTAPPGSTSSASAIRASAACAPQAKPVLEKLRAKLKSSTRK